MGRTIKDLISYLDASPTAWHAVKEAVIRLEKAGFTQLDEKGQWELEARRGYYVCRNGSSLIAFHTGRFDKDAPFRILTAHTDSPSFRIKEGLLVNKNGFLTASVEVLGGPIFATWLDRDLGIAGRVLVRTTEGLKSVLYDNPDRRVLIPNPPIHLNRQVNKGYEYNPQTQLNCILGEASGTPDQETTLYDLIASDLGIDAADIMDADLILRDRAGATLTGWNHEFLSSGRIDNLAMCHAAVEALAECDDQSAVAMAALFDNEETGSLTPQGADSSFMEQLMERIVLASGGDRLSFMRGCASSFIVSADAAHGIHPNFSDLYDESFTPVMNKGPAIKKNAGWNYASTGETSARFRLLCEKAGVPCQVYINRSDRPTGKTLGPLAASRLGIPAVDVGNPLWSMHSIRETVGVRDHEFMILAFKAHLNEG